MVSTPPNLTWWVCVCVHRLLPAPDLSPIISLVLLFTGFLIAQCLLSLCVCLYPSVPICGASSAPKLVWGCPSERRQRGEATGAEGTSELGCGPLPRMPPPTHTHTCFQVAGELKYHPECFICLTCGTFIGDGDTYTLVEHSKLYW